MFSFLKKIFSSKPKVDYSQFIKDGATILDVRTKAEFRDGHVKGSKNIPLRAIPHQLAKIAKMKQPIITCCRSGARSGAAARMLNRNGIKSINGGPWTTVRAIKGR